MRRERAVERQLRNPGPHIAYALGRQPADPAKRKVWEKAVREKGTTLVPLEILWDGSLVKLRIGLARGKKLHDKRQAKREKDDKREMDRAVKAGRHGD